MIFFTVSFLLCLILTELFKRLFVKTKIYTNKERPMLLGLAIYFSVLISFVLLARYYKLEQPFVIKILAGSFFILFLGVIDDIRRLSPSVKFIGQFLIATFIAFLGVRSSIYFLPLWLNATLSAVWIVAIVNALNFLDIMDGLCTGISLIISLSFLSVSVIAASSSITPFFWLLAGAISVSFIYNLPPAKLYLGDSGSMLLGFIFACSAFGISYAPGLREGLSLLIPVCIVALPLYDLMFTIAMRLKKHIPVTQKSPDHPALIMKRSGVSVKEILGFMYSLCLLFGVTALTIKIAPPLFKAGLIGMLSVALILLTLLVARLEKKNLVGPGRS
jgi:UDP-GlcNAc:undecaprenyl-phosphate GlcNAc-1-phosphate transferase